MRHHVRIGRQDHTLIMKVDEIDTAGRVVKRGEDARSGQFIGMCLPQP